MESVKELEQEYEMPKEDDMAFFEPEIDVKDVELAFYLFGVLVVS